MRTDDLIEMLAQGAVPVSTHTIEQRLTTAALAGLTGALGLMLALFGWREDLVQALALPMFWGKLLLVAALGWASVAVLRRLARPGLGLAHSVALLALPPLVLWVLAVVVLAQADSSQRLPLVLGSTWRSCPFNIALLSLPALMAVLWALRGAAPTRLGWAGAGAGLLAGALATLVYALHCPEMDAPFLAVWYLAGIAIPTALGAMLGPRVLRW